MITRTRAQVRALVTRRARVVDHLNSHPAADVNIDLDDSYRDLRSLCTAAKWGTFLKTTGALTLPLTPPTGENYVVVPVPVDCTTVRTLEVKRTTNWLPIEEVGFGQLRAFNGWEGFTRSSFPQAWTLLDQGVQATTAGNTGSAIAGQIALFPVPTSSGEYQLWYLPEFSNLTADSGAGGFYAYANEDQAQYHVAACAVKILISDNDSQGMLEGLITELTRFEKRIKETTPVQAGPRVWRRASNYRS